VKPSHSCASTYSVLLLALLEVETTELDVVLDTGEEELDVEDDGGLEDETREELEVDETTEEVEELGLEVEVTGEVVVVVLDIANAAPPIATTIMITTITRAITLLMALWYLVILQIQPKTGII
jgi:hypothetical protein